MAAVADLARSSGASERVDAVSGHKLVFPQTYADPTINTYDTDGNTTITGSFPTEGGTGDYNKVTHVAV